MKKTSTILTAILLIPTYVLIAQSKDKAVFQENKPGYYQQVILKDVREHDQKQIEQGEKIFFRMDQSGLDLPNKVSDYADHTRWHNPTTSQGNTNTCWCFCTTSFYESEAHRLFNTDVKLSEMFTVYWEYVERAKYYVKTRGTSAFEEGSEANAVTRSYKKYGTMPRSVYDGLTGGRKFFDHAEMIREMQTYLQDIKMTNAWNEAAIVETIRSIMNHYMGEPPAEFDFEGKHYTPQSFLKDYLKLNMDDYVEVLSYLQQPFWKKVEYEVPDNWWHSKDYYNVPLDVFMEILNRSIEKGYTLSIGGDVSEAGFSRTTNTALIPDFDIPSDYINDNARQFRFSNRTTTDDHGMHMVGYLKDKNGKMWYLIKDSSSGSRNVGEDSPEFGYYFFSEDYIKLKMMSSTVHKDMLKKYINKFE